jgi:hypothetical protein
MTSYTVYKILTHGTRQLLLIQGIGEAGFNLAVYDEHTGTTIMRMTTPTLDEFKRAISLIEDPGQNS